MDIVTYMKHERKGKIKGIYWLLQVSMAFNSNKLEGSRLTQEQTEFLFDEKKVYTEKGNGLPLDDIQETANHFRAFDYILDNVHVELSFDLMRQLHFLLKQNTSDQENPLTPVGEFKIVANIIESFDPANTVSPENVEKELGSLLEGYNKKEFVSLEDVVDFHVKFEKIHPFADGNGRVGRLIAFKECLKNNIMPSIILDTYRDFYLLGLKEYEKGSKERLLDTFRAGQDFIEDIFKKLNFNGFANNN